jgi:hypothetical protein
MEPATNVIVQVTNPAQKADSATSAGEIVPLAWPIAVVVIVVFLGLRFYRPLKYILENLKWFKTPWVEGSIAQDIVKEATGGDAARKTPPSTAKFVGPTGPTRPVPAEQRLGFLVDRNVEAHWDRVADIYWLGHDVIMVAMQMATGAPRQMVLNQLRQCELHLGKIEYSDRRVMQDLKSIYVRIEGMQEVDLTPTARRAISSELIRLRDLIGAHLEVHQPDFQGFAS